MSISYGGDYITDTDGGKLRPSSAVMRNRIINGAMVIDQRNAGASKTITSDDTYTLDRWSARSSASSKFSVQQNAGSVTPPTGFTNYLGATSLSSYSVSSGDFFSIQQSIEGYNIADLGWGTANAKSVTLSFRVYSSLTGTFGGALFNSNSTRNYQFSYSIPVANTWTTISVNIAGDTSGTWQSTNGNGLAISFSLGAGSTYTGGSAAWGSSFYFQPSGSTSVVGTSGATFYITGVQLEVGSSATGFEYRQYQQDLALCQRYFYLHASGANVEVATGYQYNSTTASVSLGFKVPMRTTPTLYSSSGTNYFITYGNGAGSYSTAVTLNAASSNNQALINITNSLTAGSGIDLRCDAAGAYIGFTAEL